MQSSDQTYKLRQHSKSLNLTYPYTGMCWTVCGGYFSTYGTFALGSESTWERKFQLPSQLL